MTPRDLRIVWRSLLAEPGYTAVAVLGLGIGLAACLLLLGYVRHAWDYNAGIPDVDNVYVIKQRNNVDPNRPWFDQGPLLLRVAAARAPGVVEATAYVPAQPNGAGLAVRVDGHLQELDALAALPNFPATLGLASLQGDAATALRRPDQIVLTTAAAQRLFGSTAVLGRRLDVHGKLMQVGAVVPARGPSTIPFDALVGVGAVVMDPMFAAELPTGAQGWWGKMLVRVRPGSPVAPLTAFLQQTVDRAPAVQNQSAEVRARLGERKVMEIVLAPLRHAYFDMEVGSNHISQPGERADPVVVAGLGGIAVLILALAAFNYINLATVRVLRRQREVAMRKVLGAGARRIALHFLAESVLVSLLATALGLLIAWLALPVFAAMMARDLAGIVNASNVAAAVLLGIGLGAVTAAYPAWIALHVLPRQVLAGRPDSESAAGARWRRGLTVLQVAGAMGLGAVALALAWQTWYGMRATPGFDPAPLLIVDLPEPDWNLPAARGFATALAAQPGVAGVTLSQDAVGRHNSVWMEELKRPGAASVSMDLKSVSPNFFALYGIRPALGRLFDARIDREGDPVPIVLNAVAARELGFATAAAALGQTVLAATWDDQGKPGTQASRIVGIAPELRFHSLRERPRAIAYRLGAAQPTLTVRASAGMPRVQAAVAALWPRYFPHAVVRMQPAGAILAAEYADDLRIARLLAAATVVALAIAAFGTYVLAAHTVQRRATEIVLRKLYGARRPDIGLLVARELGTLLLLAGVIGLPPAALAIERYLAGFVERAPVGYWTLALALAATLLIAALAATRHAWLALRLVPAQALRA